MRDFWSRSWSKSWKSKGILDVLNTMATPSRNAIFVCVSVRGEDKLMFSQEKYGNCEV